jgi:hypothetical protein
MAISVTAHWKKGHYCSRVLGSVRASLILAWKTREKICRPNVMLSSDQTNGPVMQKLQHLAAAFCSWKRFEFLKFRVLPFNMDGIRSDRSPSFKDSKFVWELYSTSPNLETAATVTADPLEMSMHTISFNYPDSMHGAVMTRCVGDAGWAFYSEERVPGGRASDKFITQCTKTWAYANDISLNPRTWSDHPSLKWCVSPVI